MVESAFLVLVLHPHTQSASRGGPLRTYAPAARLSDTTTKKMSGSLEKRGIRPRDASDRMSWERRSKQSQWRHMQRKPRSSRPSSRSPQLSHHESRSSPPF